VISVTQNRVYGDDTVDGNVCHRKGVWTIMMGKSELWHFSDSDLVGLDPDSARDLLVECFFHAQGGTFEVSARALDMEGSAAQLRETIRAAVRLKFKDLGCDFDNPTVSDIDMVTDALAQEARSWGTPDHVVDHHLKQMRMISTQLALA